MLILLGLLLTFNLVAQTNRRSIQLTGSISEKYPIAMTLAIENDTVRGFYYYEKYKTKIVLEGQVIGTKFILNESSDYEPEFKIGFIGEVTDTSFVGKWVDKTKDKRLKCELTIASDKQIKVTEDILQIEGTYEDLFNSEKYLGSVTLKNILGELFFFEISNGTESGCLGYLKGVVKLIDLQNGIFSTEACKKIEFNLLDNELILKEDNCDFHGMRCPFEGKYKKSE